MSENTTAASVFEPRIELDAPLKHYKQFIEDKMQADEILPDQVIESNFKKIAAAARDTVWKLLFGAQPASPEHLTKAAQLLTAYKSDACFYAPWEYNAWIVRVRDELLKRAMFDFWREQVVALELGPCCSRDSDYFDNAEDTVPEEFYKHAGCVAVFSKDAATTTPAAAAPVEVEAAVPATAPAVYALTLEQPLQDYKRHINDAMMVDQIVSDEALEQSFKDIATATRATIWQLLFSAAQTEVASKENLTKAAELLAAHKSDCCFYNPWDYNEWIGSVRDELLRREMLEFWREQMVKRELGPCWARDSDYFDEMDDPAPEAFYKRAGCVAAFSKDPAPV